MYCQWYSPQISGLIQSRTSSSRRVLKEDAHSSCPVFGRGRESPIKRGAEIKEENFSLSRREVFFLPSTRGGGAYSIDVDATSKREARALHTEMTELPETHSVGAGGLLTAA